MSLIYSDQAKVEVFAGEVKGLKKRKNNSGGRPPHQTERAKRWLGEHYPLAHSGVLAHLRGAPSSSVLERLYAKDDRPVWTVHFSGRGGPQKWKSDRLEHVLASVERVLSKLEEVRGSSRLGRKKRRITRVESESGEIVYRGVGDDGVDR